jgi:hypothetical protein
MSFHLLVRCSLKGIPSLRAMPLNRLGGNPSDTEQTAMPSLVQHYPRAATLWPSLENPGRFAQPAGKAKIGRFSS